MKNILYISSNPAQNDYYNLFQKAFGRKEFNFYQISNNDIWEQVFFLNDCPLLGRLYRKNDDEIFKKYGFFILKCIKVARFFLTPIRGLAYLLYATLKLKKLLFLYHKKIDLECEKKSIDLIFLEFPEIVIGEALIPKNTIKKIGFKNCWSSTKTLSLESQKKLYNNNEFPSRANRWLAKRLVPNWGEIENEDVVFPGFPTILLAFYLLGVKKKINVSNIWDHFSGGMLFSNRHKKLMEQRCNLAIPTHWGITGDLNADQLEIIFRHKYINKSLLNLSLKKKLLVIDLSWGLDVKILILLLDLCFLAKEHDWQTLCCPHPGPHKEYIEKCRMMGFKIADKPTNEILPLADLYLSPESSTIVWAAQLGIPSISFNVSGINGSCELVGTSCNGFLMDSIDYFKDFVSLLLSNERVYLEYSNIAKKNMDSFGNLDGKCGERTLLYVKNICGW